MQRWAIKSCESENLPVHFVKALREQFICERVEIDLTKVIRISRSVSLQAPFKVMPLFNGATSEGGNIMEVLSIYIFSNYSGFHDCTLKG